MKKLFLIGALFCASVSATASTRWITSCGIVFETVSQYPGTLGDFIIFLMETNADLCDGTHQMPRIYAGEPELVEP